MNAAANPTSAPRLLIVDDEEMLLRGYARALRSEFEVHTACNGGEALEMLDSGITFDLILCDLALGDIDGADLHATVSRSNPALADRMLFCSGGAVSKKLADFVEAMSGRVLIKPLPVPELRARVRVFAQGLAA